MKEKEKEPDGENDIIKKEFHQTAFSRYSSEPRGERIIMLDHAFKTFLSTAFTFPVIILLAILVSFFVGIGLTLVRLGMFMKSFSRSYRQKVSLNTYFQIIIGSISSGIGILCFLGLLLEALHLQKSLFDIWMLVFVALVLLITLCITIGTTVVIRKLEVTKGLYKSHRPIQ